MGRTKGKPDYSREIKVEACQSYIRECSVIERRHLKDYHVVLREWGGVRDGKKTSFQKAQDALSHRVWEAASDGERVKAMTSRQFRTLVVRHAYGVFKQGGKYRRTRIVPNRSLSTDEMREAAKLLGTPRNDDAGYRFYRSSQECYDSNERFKTLVDQAQILPSTLAKRLLAEFPDVLKRGKIDQRETLSDAAREARTNISDVWAGRDAWRVSGKPDKQGGGLEHGRRDVYWCAGRRLSHKNKWPYFNKYTFMMDAATVSSGTPAVSSRGEVGFYRVDEIFPPEEVRAAAPVGCQIQLMFYIIIHRTLGIVSGPDFMYTGSTSSTSRDRKHVQNFMCW